VLLAAIAQILVPLAGDLTVTGTIPGAGSRAAVASRSRPRISPFHATVDHAGPLTFRLKLNRAAKRLLARRHKLRVNLTTTLKPAVGSAITRRKRATIVNARTKPAACPKHGARRGKVHCGKRPKR
jgi:hypothetical protein